MQKRTREIVALVMLVALLIGGAVAFATYIRMGHNWNEAASHIDDHVGDMRGYTVILYEGVVPVAYGRSAEDPGRSSPTASDQRASEASDAAASEASASDENGENASEAEDKPLSILSARASYHDKGAQVLVLHIDDLTAYNDPVVVPRQGRMVAVTSALGPRPDLDLRKKAKEIRHDGVDYIIGIVDDLSVLDSGIARINIAISTDWNDADAGGRYVGKTYAVGSPRVGQIGAIIIAPSGFLSAKTLTSL